MRNLAAIMFVLAIVLGIITVMIARNVVNSQRAAPVEIVSNEPEQEMSTLVVAATKLNFGDEITAENLKVVPWPKDESVRPVGSFENIADIIGTERRVAIRAMNINDPVVQEKLSGFGFRATLSQVVPANMRAVAIRISDFSAVAGFVLPGDRVDILHVRRDGDEEEDTTSTLILRNVRVLAIDQIADETTQGAVIARTATLEVTQEQSQKLSVASKVGSLDLVLRPMRIDDDVLDEVSEPIDVRDLTTDNSLAVKEDEPVKTVKKRTYRPIYSSSKATPKPDPFTQMRVTRGTETSQTRVAKDGATAPNLNQATSNQIGVMTDTISAVVGGQ